MTELYGIPDEGALQLVRELIRAFDHEEDDYSILMDEGVETK